MTDSSSTAATRVPPLPLPLVLLLLVSAALKAWYVFALTDYPAYVVSDPAHYFLRAQALFRGDPPGPTDWEVFPMGAPVLLALWWKALALLGLDTHQLQSALALNVLASTAGVAVVWGIARALAGGRRLPLAVATGYAFFYPLVYLNAFTLSEAPSQLLFMASLLALLRARDARGRRALALLAAAGVSWAVAVHCRSSFLLAGPVAVAWLLWRPDWRGADLGRALGFGLPALAVFAGAAIWLGAASNGAAHSATGRNGGLNFFMQQCHVHGAETSSPAGRWIFVPPLTADRPELGIYATTVPFHEQRFWYREGLRCLWRDPGSFARLAAFGPTLLYGNFMPSWNSAKGFEPLLRASQHLSLLLLALSPAGAFALARRNRPGVVLLTVNAVLLAATFVAFNADHRHLYSLAFVYLIFGVAGAAALARASVRGKTIYAAVATLLVGAGVILFRTGGALALNTPRPLTAPLARVAAPLPDGSPWNHLDALRFQAPLTVTLPVASRAARLSLSTDNNDTLRLDFLLAGEPVVVTVLPPVPRLGLQRRELAVPAAARAAGFDALRLTPLSGDGRYAVAGVTLAD